MQNCFTWNTASADRSFEDEEMRLRSSQWPLIRYNERRQRLAVEIGRCEYDNGAARRQTPGDATPKRRVNSNRTNRNDVSQKSSRDVLKSLGQDDSLSQL